MKRSIVICFLITTFFACTHRKSRVQQTFVFGFANGQKANLPKHPRLLFSRDEKVKILSLAQKEPLLKHLIALLHQQADKMLGQPLLHANNQGEINLAKSRKAIYRMITLSLAYRLFDDERFAGKVEKELSNIANFKSWHPAHFLDTAEMTTAVAIGYDWCYAHLSPQTRDAVEKAIVNKAFAPAWPVYEHGGDGAWAKRPTNWNLVCNSGLVMGALAIADRYPEKARKIVQYAARFTPNEIKNYAPNGVYYEGPAYWTYATEYLCLLLDNFQRVLGDDFGLSSIHGINKTALYPTNRVFNFADAHAGTATLEPVYFFLSKEFNQPKVADFIVTFLNVN